MIKHLALVTATILAVSATSIRADDKPSSGAVPTSLGQPDASGFISLFNGKDLTGWEGLEGYWSVKNGVIDGSETNKDEQSDWPASVRLIPWRCS